MRVEGERTFAAPRGVVWEVLNDPAQMAETMPGVESFDVQDDAHWSAKVKIPLGLGGLRMSVNFERLETREGEYSRLRAKGTGVGAMMNMETGFHLSDADGGTAMRWEADVKIAGPVGSMGQRVLQPIVNQQVANVLNALDVQVQKAAAGAGGAPSGGEGAGETTGTAGAAPPSTDAPTVTKPEFYEGPEPAADPPRPPQEMEGAGAPGTGGNDVAPATAETAPGEETGSSGADEGVSPWSPEAYADDPQGPTQSTGDRG